jgi:hypothetical protein
MHSTSSTSSTGVTAVTGVTHAASSVSHHSGVSTATLEQILATSLDIVCTALNRQPQAVALLLKVMIPIRTYVCSMH